MLNCPLCHQPLQPDPNNPAKVLCYTCRKRYDASKVAEYQAQLETTAQHETNTPLTISTQEHYPSSKPPTPQTQPSYSQSYVPQPTIKPSRGCAIASLVLGIVALLGSWVPIINAVSILLGIIALILGIIALRKIKKKTGAGKCLGIGGITASLIAIILSIAMSSLFIIGVNATLSETDNYTYDEYMSEITSVLKNEFNPYSSIISGANGKSSWSELVFSVNGTEYELMKSTLSDLEESGYTLDLEGQGYPNGYIVEPGQMISVIELEGQNEYNEYFIVNVANLTESPMDIKECVLTKFDYDNSKDENAISICGITCGATPEEVEETFGIPQDTEENNPYIIYQYETNKYSKYFQVIFADGVVKGFTLSSMEY